MSAPEEIRPGGTLLEALERQAASQPNEVAFVFVVDGETQEESLTYGELYRRARAIAAQLQALGEAGERAIILCPAGLDYIAAFFGCICSGWIAVPLYAPNPSEQLDTIRNVVRSAQPRAAITTREAQPALQGAVETAPELATLHWLVADDIRAGSEDGWRRPALGPDSLAYIGYTSGSTSAPKGVPKRHSDLPLIPALYHDRDHRRGLLNWTPPHATGGLLCIMLPVSEGMPAIHMAPEAFLERPARWLEAMSRTRAMYSWAPNFGFDLAVDGTTPEERERLDLSSWIFAFSGGEQVRADTVERFQAAFAVSGLRPGTIVTAYGLSEAAAITSMRPGKPLMMVPFDRAQLEARRVAPLADRHADAEVLVGQGQPAPHIQLLIVNPVALQRCASDEVGEIWTAGPHVAQGYWNAPEATRETFEAYLGSGDGPYFRTGDLGFLYEGELFIAGRLKDIIIIRGRNIHANDVELAARRSHPLLVSHANAAFAMEDSGEERLVLVQEIEEAADLPEIADAVRQAVAGSITIQPHVVVLVPPGTIPRTDNGKIRRAACRDAFIAHQLPILYANHLGDRFDGGRGPYTAPTTELERELATIWEGVLGVQPIGIYDQFLDLGGDSLRSLQVQARMRERGIALGMAQVQRHGTIAALARAAQDAPATSAEQDGVVVGPVPLQLMQYGVLGNRPKLPADLVVGIPLIATEPIDPQLLEGAARALLFQHDALRMRFLYTDGRWQAECIGYSPDRIVSVIDLAALSETDVTRRMRDEEELLRQAVDIQHGPLLQIGLFHQGEEGSDRLILFLPHLVFDAFSLTILLNDLNTAYGQLRAGKPVQLPSKTTSIRRWGEQLHALGASEELLAEVPYWLDVLRAEPSTIPENGEADATADGGMTDVWSRLGRDETSYLLREAPSRDGIRVADAVLAAVARAVSRHTGSQTVLIDLLGHGREPLNPDIDLSRTVGYFTTLFPVRLTLDSDESPVEQAVSVRAQIEQVPRHGLGFDLLRYLCPASICAGIRAPNRPIRLNVVGQIESALDAIGHFHLDDSMSGGDENNANGVLFSAPPTGLIDIAAYLTNEALGIRLRYHTQVYHRATIEEFAGEIEAALIPLTSQHL